MSLLFDVRQVGVVSEDDNYVYRYYLVNILSTTYTMKYETIIDGGVINSW